MWRAQDRIFYLNEKKTSIVCLNKVTVYVKTCKKSISKFHFSVKLYEIRKKVIIQNYLLHEDIQVWISTFFHKIYIFLFNLKKYY